MALKAGRRGLNKRLVDAFGNFNGEVPSGEYYTKTQTDNKFETKTHVNNTFQKKTLELPLETLMGSKLTVEASLDALNEIQKTRQPKTLEVPLEMLSGSKLTVETALQGLNEEKFTYADNGVLGAKNLNGSKYIAETSASVTFTPIADNIITVNGTATDANAQTNDGTIYRFIAPVTAQVLLSGVPSNAPDGVVLFVWDYTINSRPYADASMTTKQTADVKNNNSEVSFYMIKGNVYYVRVRVNQNTVVNNVTISPMIRLASDPDDTYVPYAMTNRELTEMVKRTVLLGTDNLDTVFGYGDYYWENIYPANTPENLTFGSMRVYPCGEITYQEIIRASSEGAVIYIRRHQNSWSAWCKFIGTVVS